MTGGVAVDLDVRDDGVAIVTLNRPARLNAFSVAMRDALWEALLAVRDHPGVVCAVVGGNGPHFSVGADLSEFGTAGSLFEARRVRYERPVWELLWSLEKPLVAALRGYALGSGLELALMCDARLAEADVQIGLPEARFGMLPAAGGTQTFTRAAGVSRALAAILRCERMDAERAREAGVVDAIVEDVDASALALAASWAALGPARARGTKLAVRAALDLPPDAALAAERRLARVVRAAEPGASP